MLVWLTKVFKIAVTVAENPQPRKARRGFAADGATALIASPLVSLLKEISIV